MSIYKKNEKIMLNVAQTAAAMMVLTLVSKLLGFAREMVLASAFGTSYIVDAYVLANSIPTIILGGIFGSIGTAFMPTFASISENRGEKEGERFTNQTLTFTLVVSIIGFAFGFAFSESIVRFFARNFTEQGIILTSFYLKISFSYLMFSNCISILTSRLQYKGIFIPNIVAGYLLNVGIIIVTVVSKITTYKFLAFGYLAGYFLQFVCIYRINCKSGYHYSIDIGFNESIKEIIGLAIPVFLSSSLAQINTFVDKTLASGLDEGSISSLNYGYLVIGLVLSFTVAIIASLMYPKIAKAASVKEWRDFNAISERCISTILVAIIPFCFGSLAFAKEVIQIIYERGAFSVASTQITSEAFFFYSFGLPFTALNTILTQIYFSLKDTKATLICSVGSLLTNVVLNLLLIDRMKHCGLALATSISAMVYTFLLFFYLVLNYKEIKVRISLIKLIKVVAISSVSVASAKGLYSILSLYIVPRICSLGICVLVAVFIYLVLMRLLKFEEINVLIDLLPKRGKKNDK